MKVHPAAKWLPEMTEEAMEHLTDWIKRLGLLEPIEVYDNQLLCGRHRLKACKQAGIEPEYVDVTDKVNALGTPEEYVMAKDGPGRRHLTLGQFAIVIGRYQKHLSDKGDPTPTKKAHASAEGVMSERQVQLSAKVVKHGVDELQQAVERNHIKISSAARIADLEPDAQRAMVESVVDKAEEEAEAANDKEQRKPKKLDPVGELHKMREPYAEIIRAVKKIKQAISRMSDGKEGIHVNAMQQRLKNSASDISTVMDQLSPQVFCKQCKRKGCERCSGTGFITKGQMQSWGE